MRKAWGKKAEFKYMEKGNMSQNVEREMMKSEKSN